jgi:hypothetical protein
VASATAALRRARGTTDRTTDVSIGTARPTDIAVAGIAAMPVGAVARATLTGQGGQDFGTGATVRGTAGAGLGPGDIDTDVRAAVGVRRASARVCDAAGAVDTCLAGGAAPAAPTAAVIATLFARAVDRRAARSADTHLARSTRNTGAGQAIAVLTLAGVAGSSQTGRAADSGIGAARVIYTGIAGITAMPIAAGAGATVVVSGAGTSARGTDAPPGGTDS